LRRFTIACISHPGEHMLAEPEQAAASLQDPNPNTSFGSNFGFITGTLSSGTGVNGTGGGRVVQLGAKLTF
jgi:hypothetical protein